MNKLSAFVVLTAVVLFTESFKSPVDDKPVTASPITALVNGKSFILNQESACSAQWNASAKTTQLTFVGADVHGKDGYAQAQKITVLYKVNEVGDILVKGIAYELDGKKYENVPEATSMNVSKFEWSSDKKSFVISASFDCKAQSTGPFQANDDAVAVKGSIENIKVNVSSSDVAAIAE